MADLVYKSRVKDAISERGLNSSDNAIDAFEDELERLIDDAVERTEENGRKTVKARDV